MKASHSRPEIELTYEDISALLAFAAPSSSKDPKAQVLFRRVPYPENTSRVGTRELCQAIATDGTALLVLEGPGSDGLFAEARIAVNELIRYCPKKNAKRQARGTEFSQSSGRSIWIRTARRPGGIDIYDEDGLVNQGPLSEPDVPFPPWQQALPQRVQRAEYMPAREISLGVQSWKRLDLVCRAVGCEGIMLRISHPQGNGDERLDVVRFDTEPGKNGMRAKGAFCGRRRV